MKEILKKLDEIKTMLLEHLEPKSVNWHNGSEYPQELVPIIYSTASSSIFVGYSCIQKYENYEYTDWTDIETAVDISNFYNDFCEKNENRYAYFQLFNVEKL